MRKRLLAVAVTLASVIAPNAHAGWRGAEWGMTPEDVQTAMKGEAPLGESWKDDTEDKVRNIGEYVWEGHKFRALYRYDAQGLSAVTLEWKSKVREKDCQALLENVIAGSGPPLRVSDQVLFKNIIWHDKESQNRIRLMVSLPAGICALHMERLSDYEAHDLANPGPEVVPPKRG